MILEWVFLMKNLKKRIVALSMVITMAVSATGTASAVYQSRSLETWESSAAKSNISALGGTWSYNLSRAYIAESSYNHNSKRHRTGVYTEKDHWQFSGFTNAGSVASKKFTQTNSHKAASCATY